MSKVGAVSFLAVLVLAVIFCLFVVVLLSAQDVEEFYLLGDKVKIDFESEGSYKAKITTPSTTTIVNGQGASFIYEPTELGKHIIKVRRGWRTQNYVFTVVSELITNPDNNITNETLLNNSFEDLDQGYAEIGQQVKWIEQIGDFVREYYTEPAQLQEVEKKNKQKRVRIVSNETYSDVEAYTDIDEVATHNEEILVYWLEAGIYLGTNATDTDGNGLIDRVQWRAPNIFNDTENTFLIIVITKAEYLDEDRNFIEDVYGKVRETDGIYSPVISNGEYVRVTFETNLTSKNDITVVTRGSGSINVYDENYNYVITISNLSGIGRRKTYLTPLIGVEDVFYLQVTGSLEFDLIIDPVVGGAASGGLRPQIIQCFQQAASTTCDGSYPTSCPGSGGSDYLSCNDASAERHTSRKDDVARVNGSYYDTSITDCVEIQRVEVCYDWQVQDTSFYQCRVGFDSAGDGTFSNADSTCSTAGYANCYDATGEPSETWTCGNFFGASGTRAALRAYGISNANNARWLDVDQLWYNITYAGAGNMIVNLSSPSTVSLNSYTIYDTFIVNATLVCTGDSGDTCGIVNASLNYNVSGINPDTVMSSTPGAVPMYANDTNKSCGRLNVSSGEDTCNLIWMINVTQKGTWKIGVDFFSEFSLVGTNNTDNATIRVSDPANLIVNLTSPLTPYEINESASFDVNCTATCLGQTCSNTDVRLIYCNTSSSCTPSIWLNTTSFGISTDLNSVNLGDVLVGTPENATFTITGDLTGDYVMKCNVTTTNDGNTTSGENVTLHVNDDPIASFTYPSASEWLSASESLDGGGSSDTDGTISNYAFEIDDNLGFSDPTTVCDSASSTCVLNTVSQGQCSQETSTCYLRLNVTDNDGVMNSTILQVGIDNVGASATMDKPDNDSYIVSESYTLNASALDSGSGVDCVEFSFYNGTWNNLSVDCASDYEYSWDLSDIIDQADLQVRARANDSEGNFGSYNAHGNITHDTTPPVVVSVTPVDTEIINTSTYVLNASLSSDATAGVKNASWYYYNITSGEWVLIGVDSSSYQGLNYTWTINIPDGAYDISVNLSDNAGLRNSTIVSNVVIDIVNDDPTCQITYPNSGLYLNNDVIITATASEDDPSDYVNNVSFYYSTNNGTDWSFIATNITINLSSYSYVWDTTLDVDSVEYLVRCNVTDSRTGWNSDEGDTNFTIDNTNPSVTNWKINHSGASILINENLCFNVSVTDNSVGVSSVIAEIDPPIGGNVNLTLFDDGSGCDTTSGDNVYSGIYQSTFDGNYNWTQVYANDTLDNLNRSVVGLNWTVTSNAYLIADLLSPTLDIEINESDLNTNFTMQCNITCNDSGGNCNDVEISSEYEVALGVWVDITTATSDLVNDENFYDCGFLAQGDSCIHTFNVSAGQNSGGNTWAIRCHGASSNAAADFSTEVDLHVNNNPVANFTYPTNGTWLSGTEILNGSLSNDTDGSIINYQFEIDDNFAFSDPYELCNSADENCTLDTILGQNECSQENDTCFLRLTTLENDGLTNSTIIQIGIDNVGPNATLDRPLNNTLLTGNGYAINLTALDLGSGVDCAEYSFYNGTWNTIGVNCTNPYQYFWDLTTLFDSKFLEVRVRANDSEGNFGNYSIHGNLTRDTTLATITTYYPGNNSFVNVSNIVFNFSSYDNLGDTLNCELILDGNVNVTNSSVINATLTEFLVNDLSQGMHNWSVNCSDYAGNENFSSTYNFTVDTITPVVNLEYPPTGIWSNSNNVVFNYTPSDINLDVCELWGNWSAGWHKNDTNSDPVTDILNTFNKNISDGTYLWNVWCNDSAANSAFNSTNYTLNIDTTFPLISFNNNTDENNTLKKQTWVFINVTASDINNNTIWLQWTNSSGDTNESFTNQSGNIYFVNKTGLVEGQYKFIAYINDSAGNLNKTKQRIVDIDLTAPKYINQNQTFNGLYTNIFHRGEIINLSANWSDNYDLNYAWLATNETGAWKNVTGNYESVQNISGNNTLSVFNWTNATFALGDFVGWRIYANDSSGNINVTNIMNFQSWGYSKIFNPFLNPSGIPGGDRTTMSCQVLDNVTGAGISGYTVNFYNDSIFLGSNVTEVGGVAVYSWNETSPGSHTILCNITDNASLYYNASINNYGTDLLGVGYQLTIYDYTDTTNNKAYEGINVNDLSIYTPIIDSYSFLTNNDSQWQVFRTDTDTQQGQFAYTRFEFKINEAPSGITNLTLIWVGSGSVGTGTDGYNLSIYNTTLGGWQSLSVYIAAADLDEQTEIIYFDSDIASLINGSDYAKILIQSYDRSATTGSGGFRWAETSNNLIKLEVYSDIIPPEITLQKPDDFYNTSNMEVDFTCYVTDNFQVATVSLYGNWSGAGWHANQTNSSGLRDVNYTFTVNISEGAYVWNCYACDTVENCEFFVQNRSFNVDLTPPNVNFVYPINNENFSNFNVPNFTFNVNDNFWTKDCELWGNWSSGWHKNQTLNGVTKGVDTNFSSINLQGDNFYIWNVNCSDYAGNWAYNSTNFSFAAFLFPDYPAGTYFNITQTSNNGQGNVTLLWNSSNHSIMYNVYYAPNLSTPFSFLGSTSVLNYTDDTANQSRRRFYRVSAWNPTGENYSSAYFGKTVYYLKRLAGINTRNWVGMYMNITTISNANTSVWEITNATTFSMWNATLQQRITCNRYTCPDPISCTNTTCNFNLKAGLGYEVNINDSAPVAINWSAVGVVYDPVNINLYKNATDFGKNWVSMYANTTLLNANALISSVTNADSVTDWDEDTQTTKGYIYLNLPGIPYLGNNFNINIEDGYEASVTASGAWLQE
ncbi:hypothetical protein GOV14_05380 [Candidatus Pacearchaeota archaeon]|nr:hypothetical protein [Candidatus Pacearchaeota archaeon]